LLAVATARAQESAPVTIDASPTAAELLQRAQDVAAQNPGESARLIQEAVDRFPGKLVPWPPEPYRYRAVAQAAQDLLQLNPGVRERWLMQEAPVAERAVADGYWLDAVRARAATPAGLQAMLLLAQYAMDEGRPLEARLWVGRALQHPALDDSTRARLVAARDALQSSAPPAPRTPTAQREVEDWQPLWSIDNPTAWLSRLRGGQDPELATRTLDARTEDGSALAAQPRFDGDTVALADGSKVQVFDRYSGSRVHSASVGLESDRPSQSLGDLTVAVPVGEVLVTLPGHALPDQRSGMARVTAVRAADGRRIWDVSLESLGRAEFEDLFPHGEPLAIGDLVVVQARKSNSRLESAAWVLAFQARSGRLQWAVPIGAAGGVRLAASRPLSSPAALGDDVFVATSLGVVARLDGATGETRWMRRWPAPIREPRGASPAWQLPSPVADDRLVAWLAPDTVTLVGLDPGDGRTLWTVPVGVDTPVGAARTLLLDERHLYVIGDDVVALDRADPTRVVWRLDARMPDRVGPIRGVVTLGTMADGSSALVVPRADRVVLVAPDDGRIVGQWLGRGGGNAALDRGELAIAGASSLSLLMPAAKGERVLRERLAQKPGDPRRALALVELGRAWKRPQLVVDGATAVAEALQADPSQPETLRDEIVLRMLEACALPDLGLDQAERILSLARSIASTPVQQARVLLSRAARAAGDRRMSEAEACWRGILQDPRLDGVLLKVTRDRSVAAGVLARQALAAHGDAAAQGWERDLRARTVLPTLPAVGALETRTRWVPGSLVSDTVIARAHRPVDAVLMHERSALVKRRASDLEPAWKVPIETREAQVLGWSPRWFVWCPRDAADGTLLAIDPDDGRVGIRIDAVARLFERPVETRSADRQERSRLERIDVCVSGARVVLLRGDGAVVALRIDGSGAAEWTARMPIRRLDAFDEDDDRIAMVGAGDTNDAASAIVVLDTTNGRPMLEAPWPSELGSPSWVALVPGGVAVAGSEGMAVLERTTGMPMRWRLEDARFRGLDVVALLGERLLLADGQRRLAAVGLRDGEFVPDFARSSDGASISGVHAVQALSSGLLVQQFNGLTLHDERGALRGEAFTATARRHDHVAEAADGVFSIESVQGDALRAAGSGMLLAVRRFDAAEGLRAVAPPIVLQVEGLRLSDACAIDGWLLLGGDDQSLAIAGQAGETKPR
jgi:outer membrane protein assembly factor BamB